MKALVLTGGNIKGAYQAGAIHALANRNYVPDVIFGTSVGSLNGLFLAHTINSEIHVGADRFRLSAADLVSIWLNEIKSPSQLVRKRGVLDIALDFIRGRSNGLIDITRLYEFVAKHTEEKWVKNGLPIFVSIVEYSTGDLHTVEILNNYVYDIAIDSCREPVIMPYSTGYYDGGVRDIAPLKAAIDYGADEIMLICCQPEKLSIQDPKSNMEILSRTLSIMTNEILNNDIRICNKVNDRVVTGLDMEHKKIKLDVIRPASEFDVNITNFTSKDIIKMVDQGIADAQVRVY